MNFEELFNCIIAVQRMCRNINPATKLLVRWLNRGGEMLGALKRGYHTMQQCSNPEWHCTGFRESCEA